MQNIKRFFRLAENLWKDKKRHETYFVLIRNQQVRGSTPRAGSSFPGIEV